MTRKIGIVCCSDGFNRAYEGEIEELHRILADMGIESVLSPFLYARDGVAGGTAEERAKAVMDFTWMIRLTQSATYPVEISRMESCRIWIIA